MYRHPTADPAIKEGTLAQTTIDDVVAFLGLAEVVTSDGNTATFTAEELSDCSSYLNTTYSRFSVVANGFPDAARMLLGEPMTDGLADLGMSDGGLFDAAGYYLDAISTLYNQLSGINPDAATTVGAAWQAVDTAINETKQQAAVAAGG